MKSTATIFKEILTETGFGNYKPSEMSNSDYWMCTEKAMERYADQFKNESKNNWIKLESEEDLPNDIDGLWEVVINGEQKFIELLKDNKERLYKDFLKDGITHYKICNKSQPPLY